MIALTLGDVAAATGGRLAGDADAAMAVTGVSIDSRAVAPGDLFVALPGERVDGHDFAVAAIGSGAVAVLGTREVDVPAVVVPGPAALATVLGALDDLAREVLARRRALTTSRGPAGADPVPFDVVGVTGSSGKTSTKDLLAAVLAHLGPVVAPPGSMNNEIGAPLTVLRVEETTRTLVAEMGARSTGHIAALCAMTAPRIGVVLNVGSAHLGVFGSADAVASAKGELVEALPPAADGGVAVLNADDERVAAMASRTSAAVLDFGLAPTAQVRASDVVLDDLGRPSFTLSTPAGGAPVSLPLHGEHHVHNALAAAAVAHALGLDVAATARALSGAVAVSRYRMEVTRREDGVTVVNDAYNANPESVRAALRALVAMRGTAPDGARGRTWAVLGEMLELGAGSTVAHDEIGRFAVRLDVSHLVAVGAGARPLHTGALLEGSWGEESVWLPDVADVEQLLSEELRPGDVVLVKASNSVGLHALGERLAAGLADAAGHRAPGGTVAGATR